MMRKIALCASLTALCAGCALQDGLFGEAPPAQRPDQGADMALDMVADQGADMAPDDGPDLTEDMAQDMAQDMTQDMVEDMVEDMAVDMDMTPRFGTLAECEAAGCAGGCAEQAARFVCLTPAQVSSCLRGRVLDGVRLSQPLTVSADDAGAAYVVGVAQEDTASVVSFGPVDMERGALMGARHALAQPGELLSGLDMEHAGVPGALDQRVLVYKVQSAAAVGGAPTWSLGVTGLRGAEARSLLEDWTTRTLAELSCGTRTMTTRLCDAATKVQVRGTPSSTGGERSVIVQTCLGVVMGAPASMLVALRTPATGPTIWGRAEGQCGQPTQDMEPAPAGPTPEYVWTLAAQATVSGAPLTELIVRRVRWIDRDYMSGAASHQLADGFVAVEEPTQPYHTQLTDPCGQDTLDVIAPTSRQLIIPDPNVDMPNMTPRAQVFVRGVASARRALWTGVSDGLTLTCADPLVRRAEWREGFSVGLDRWLALAKADDAQDSLIVVRGEWLTGAEQASRVRASERVELDAATTRGGRVWITGRIGEGDARRAYVAELTPQGALRCAP